MFCKKLFLPNSQFKNTFYYRTPPVAASVINDEQKNIQDPMENIVVKLQFHPSILMIKNKIKNTNTFV